MDFCDERPLSIPECGFSHAWKISHIFTCIVSASKTSWDPLCRQRENICLMPVSLWVQSFPSGNWEFVQPYFSACLMAETKQWVTHRNIWFVDDFCLWATVVRLSFLEDRVSNQSLKWIPRTESCFFFFSRQHVIVIFPLWDDCFTTAETL